MNGIFDNQGRVAFVPSRAARRSRPGDVALQRGLLPVSEGGAR